MLSKREKDGFLDILKGLPKDELLSLAQTVTMKQIVVTNRDGGSTWCISNRAAADPGRP